jgi:hypothetical protein
VIRQAIEEFNERMRAGSAVGPAREFDRRPLDEAPYYIIVLAGLTSAAETNASAVAGPELQQAFQAFLEKKPFSWRSMRPGQS